MTQLFLGKHEKSILTRITILQKMANGEHVKAIADDLELNEGSVRVNLNEIRRINKINSNIQLVAEAIRRGVIN